jgi:hypothetical protein
MKIADKWKFFAMANFLSDWEGEAAELFDKLCEAEDRELIALFEAYSIDVWQPFEYWAEVDVFEKIWDLASSAQNIENEVTI